MGGIIIPTTQNTISGPAGGDLSGNYPNPLIALGAIVNNMVSNTAAIAGTKIAPNFGSQVISSSAGANFTGAVSLLSSLQVKTTTVSVNYNII